MMIISWAAFAITFMILPYWIPWAKIFAKVRGWVSVLIYAFSAGALAYLLIGNWQGFVLPGCCFLLAGLQSALYRRSLVQDNGHRITGLFFILASSGAVALLLPPASSYWQLLFGEGYIAALLMFTGWMTAAFPSGTIINEVLKKYQTIGRAGFTDGGRLIGILERSVLFILLLINAPLGAGFLITAKTLFRFGEISNNRNRRQVEYILIGTLLSFLIGMTLTLLSMVLSEPYLAGYQYKLLH